uniref:7TM_GPCR_Srx domain-containing protein n=1 Tax=Parastrongyloides trichosuri TaxID=131310 RepID=A0A0N4ZZA5_PARTI
MDVIDSDDLQEYDKPINYYTFNNESYDYADFYNYDFDAFSPVTPIAAHLSHIQIGIIHLSLSIIFFIIQLLFFYSIRKISIKDNIPFKIIFHHGILSFVQQLCHIITSILTIEKSHINLFLIALLGSFLHSFYIGGVILIFILTVNRFDIIYDTKYFPTISRKKIFKISIIITYISMMGFFIFFMIPQYRLIFNLKRYEWTFVNITDENREVILIESKIVFIFLILSFIFQVLIFTKVISLRCKTSGKVFYFNKDFKLILYSVLCFATTAFVEICWSGLFLKIYETWYGGMLPQILFIIVSGANTTFSFFCVK